MFKENILLLNVFGHWRSFYQKSKLDFRSSKLPNKEFDFRSISHYFQTFLGANENRVICKARKCRWQKNWNPFVMHLDMQLFNWNCWCKLECQTKMEKFFSGKGKEKLEKHLWIQACQNIINIFLYNNWCSLPNSIFLNYKFVSCGKNLP